MTRPIDPDPLALRVGAAFIFACAFAMLAVIVALIVV